MLRNLRLLRAGFAFGASGRNGCAQHKIERPVQSPQLLGHGCTSNAVGYSDVTGLEFDKHTFDKL